MFVDLRADGLPQDAQEFRRGEDRKRIEFLLGQRRLQQLGEFLRESLLLDDVPRRVRLKSGERSALSTFAVSARLAVDQLMRRRATRRIV
jgi:hypothetical protein